MGRFFHSSPPTMDTPEEAKAKEEARLMRAMNRPSGAAKRMSQPKTTPEWKRRQREKEAQENAAKAEGGQTDADCAAYEAQMAAIREGTQTSETEEQSNSNPAPDSPQVDTKKSQVDFLADEDEKARREEERLMKMMTRKSRGR